MDLIIFVNNARFLGAVFVGEVDEDEVFEDEESKQCREDVILLGDGVDHRADVSGNDDEPHHDADVLALFCFEDFDVLGDVGSDEQDVCHNAEDFHSHGRLLELPHKAEIAGLQQTNVVDAVTHHHQAGEAEAERPALVFT